MTAKVTRIDSFIFLFVGYVESYVSSVQIQSLSPLKEKIEQAIVAVSTECMETFEKCEMHN